MSPVSCKLKCFVPSQGVCESNLLKDKSASSKFVPKKVSEITLSQKDRIKKSLLKAKVVKGNNNVYKKVSIQINKENATGFSSLLDESSGSDSQEFERTVNIEKNISVDNAEDIKLSTPLKECTNNQKKIKSPSNGQKQFWRAW